MGDYVSFKCANCGSVFLDEIEEGKKLRCRHCKCEYLREVETDEQRNARIKYITELNDAEKHLRISPPDFDKAESLFRYFINEYSNRYEGYWGLVRARHGIKYELDTNRKEVPSCYISAYEDFRNDSDFKKALELATHSIIYNDLKDKADLIADVCKEWREEARKYSYDIFISFKDENKELGISDADRIEMENLYRYLWRKGYRKVFFSPISLDELAGKHYDPYIFNALQTAKALIVYGSKPEYFTSTWVQNEWTRFLRMMDEGEKKKGSCIVAYKGFNARELPSGLHKIQAIDASKGSFYAEVMDKINEVFKEEKKVDSNEELMRKIAELERKQAEGKKEEQRRQEELQKKLEESQKQQEALEKSLEEEKKKLEEEKQKLAKEKQKNSENVIKQESKAVSEVESKPAEVASAKKKESDSNADDDFEIVDGYLKKYKGNKAEVVIPKEVTSIGDEAFKGCSSLTCITIPDSVTTIGNYAFRNCSSLTSVTISDRVRTIGDSAFWDCSSLASVTIGDSVTSIGSNAFYCCSSLTSITIPDSVTSIGKYAFYKCDSLTSMTIPNSVTSIGNDAFSGCSSLASVTIGDSVTSIGKYAFHKCDSLKDVYVFDVEAWLNIKFGTDYSRPNSYSTLHILDDNGNEVTDLVIPDGVTNIPDYAFVNAKNIISITIPDGVNTIGYHVFSGCSNLTSITIPDSATYIDNDAFDGTAYYNDESNWVDGVLYIGNHLIKAKNTISGEYVIKDGTIIIANSAFRYCRNLTVVTIPDSVTSIDWYAFSDCSSLTSITIPDSVTYIDNDAFDGTAYYNDESNWVDGVLYIGNHLIKAKNTISGEYVIKDGTITIADNALRNCDNLRSITIPNSVTSIGCNAFSGTAYYNDESNWVDDVLYVGNHLIEAKNTISGEYVIKDGTLTIAGFAFCDCDSLTSITIPDSVTSIGREAFQGCSSLTIYVNDLEQTKKWDPNWNPDGRPVKVIEKAASVVTGKASSSKTNVTPTAVVAKKENSNNFEIVNGCLRKYKGVNDEVVIPDGVTSIKGDYTKGVFRECKTVTKVTISNSVKTIGNYAFKGCSSLTSITIPDSVTSIGNYAFSGCSRLTGVTIPNSVASIGDYAFFACYSLTSITIPDSVTTIGKAAFASCPNLANIIVDKNNQNYKSINGNLYTKDGTTLIQYANGKKDTWFEIPTSVNSIGDYAFYDCKSLTSITIPDSVTSIGKEAFRWCSRLSSVIIPDSVTSIGWEAFGGCDNLSDITIGNSVSSIGWGAFRSCHKLTRLTIPYSVEKIDLSAFKYCSSLSSVTFKDPKGWIAKKTIPVPLLFLDNAKKAAKYLTSTFVEFDWTKKK